MFKYFYIYVSLKKSYSIDDMILSFDDLAISINNGILKAENRTIYGIGNGNIINLKTFHNIGENLSKIIITKEGINQNVSGILLIVFV